MKIVKKTKKNAPDFPKGFLSWGGNCGIKDKASDLGILYCPDAVASAAVFTKCQVKAAPVLIAQKAGTSKLKAFLVNSGNANACTGEQGTQDAIASREQLAELLSLSPKEVLVSSTGKIGDHLPIACLSQGITKGATKLKAGSSADFAQAILTTDLVLKHAQKTLKINGKTVTLTGVTKGSGMIEPNMATMLGYIATDINTDSATLKQCLKAAVTHSFNAITVDGHMSTNDTVAIIASGKGPHLNKSNLKAFQEALSALCLDLAQQIIRDGEGATKFVTVEITNAPKTTAAIKMARAIANSPLVKTAIHGEDPNWGRIVSAAGFGSNQFNPDKSSLTINGVIVYANGVPTPPTKKHTTAAEKSMKQKDIHILLNCNNGKAGHKLYTCDLSRDYIRINADYHT